MKGKISKIIFFKIKLIKYLLMISLFLSLIAGIGFFSFVYFYPKENIRELVIKNAEEILQKKIDIKKIDYGFKGIELNGVKIFSDLNQAANVFTEINQITLRFSLLSVLEGHLALKLIFINGLDLKILFNESKVSNLEEFIKQMKTDEKKSFFNLKKTKVIFNQAKINLPNPIESLLPLKGSFLLNATFSFNEPQNNYFIYNCSIQLPGKRGVLYPELFFEKPGQDFKLKGKMRLKDLDLSWVYQWLDDPKSAPSYKKVTAQITNLTITSEFAQGRVHGSSTLFNSSKIVSAEGDCLVDFSDPEEEKIFITKTKAEIKEESLFSRVMDKSTAYIKSLSFNTDSELFDFNVLEAEVSFQDLKLILDFIPFGSTYGHLKGNLSYQDKKYNGFLEFINSGYNFQKKMVSNLNMELKIKDNLFKKEDVKINILGHPCLVSLASTEKRLTDYFIPKLFLNIKTESPLTFLSQNKKKSFFEFFKPSFEILGKVEIKQLLYDDLKLSNLNFNYNLSEKQFRVNNFSLQALGGGLSGEALVLTSGKKNRVSTSLNFSNILIQDLNLSHPSLKDKFFGIGEGKADLDFFLNDFSNSLKGDINFNIANGKLADTGLQNGLGVWLRELKYKLKDLEFNNIYGQVLISKNIYRLEPFILKADDIFIQVEGEVNDNFFTPNLEVALKFNKNFIKDVTATSAFSYTIRKKLKNGWYHFTFNIEGDVTESKNIKMLN